MSFTEVIEELPRMTTAERQQIIRRALELDDTSLSPADEALVESRLAAHHANPESSPVYAMMKRKMRSPVDRMHKKQGGK